MSDSRPRQSRDPVERRIARLLAQKTRHGRRQELARLERQVAALPDPTRPTEMEVLSTGTRNELETMLREAQRMRREAATAAADSRLEPGS